MDVKLFRQSSAKSGVEGCIACCGGRPDPLKMLSIGYELPLVDMLYVPAMA